MLQQRTLRLAPASRGTASSPAREQPVGGQSTGKHTRTAKGTAAAARCVRRRSARTRRSPGGHNARNGAEPGHDELRRRSGRMGMEPSCQRKAATRMGLGTAKHEFRGSAGCLRRLSRAVVAGGTSAASVTRLGRWIRAAETCVPAVLERSPAPSVSRCTAPVRRRDRAGAHGTSSRSPGAHTSQAPASRKRQEEKDASSHMTRSLDRPDQVLGGVGP